MKTIQINRLSPLPLRKGKVLRNRVIVPPMASQTATRQGFVTNETLNHYIELSQSSASLIIVEYSYIHSTGRSEENQLGVSDDSRIIGLRDLASSIQKSGALAGIQLTHAGGKTNRELTGGILMGASLVAVPTKDQQLEIPTPMTHEQISDWKKYFVDAACRAYRAGFDLIEIHSAHGYGLNQWLSPLTNKRNDRYGGSLENRMRLLVEIVQDIRAQHPNLLISVRMPGQDFFDGGFTTTEAVTLAQTLEKLGVDLIHVSSGIGGWRRPKERTGEGYLVKESATIQNAVHTPVIGVGGIQTASYIDDALKNKQFSLAAVGRAISTNPKHFYENIFSTTKIGDSNER